MEWLKLLLPFVGVLLGWVLSESGMIYSSFQAGDRVSALQHLTLSLRCLIYCAPRDDIKYTQAIE